jgi:hypothetical protein
MANQVGLTVVAPIKSGQLQTLRGALQQLAANPAANPLIPFGRVSGTHYARFFVIEPTTDLRGQPIPAELVFMIELDAPLDLRLERLVDVGHRGLNLLFGMCEGFPTDRQDRDSCLAYIRTHTVNNSAYYVNTVGLDAERVRLESELREMLEDWLDEAGDLRSQDPAAIRDTLTARVRQKHELAWAVQQPDRPDLSWRLGELVHAILIPLAGVLLLPVILVALLFWLVALRVHERADPAPDIPPDPSHERELADLEDYGPVNQFTAIGFIKPGWFRAFTARAVLFLIDYGVRHIFSHANLAGVKTIHFARWTFIDGGRRVIFASNYDGSLESYMDDFIDKVSWGLNAVFSNGVGYPTTRWLLLGGARNERAFKNYLRVHQVPTQVWFAAYPQLSALNVANNLAVRRGLTDASLNETAANWLRRL